MFWNKKESESGLPDLPPIKNRIPFSDKSEEKHSLPSFPDVPSQRGFTQAAIKEAVNNTESYEEPEEVTQETLPPVPGQNIRTIEMEEWAPEKLEFPEQPKRIPQPMPLPKIKIPEIEVKREVTPVEPLEQVQKIRAPAQDIFVKIDKFRTVRKTLQETGTKLQEIDEMLKRIKEIKLREEQELSGWEREISSTRARIHEITSEIFEKVE